MGNDPNRPFAEVGNPMCQPILSKSGSFQLLSKIAFSGP